MWWPWHFDQAGHDLAEERAEREFAKREETDFLAMLEAHTASTKAGSGTAPNPTKGAPE